MKNIIITTAVCFMAIALHAQNLKPFKGNKEKWGYKNESGTEIIPARYEYAWDFSEGLAMVKNKKDKYGFIDETGKEIIPLKYESAKSFGEGLACVKLDGKYGFIDKTGKETIPLKYDETGNFSEGLASVRSGSVKDEKYGTLKGGKWGFIDNTGAEIIPLKYENAGNFSEGLANVKLNGKYGFIDKTGNEIISPYYDGAGDFSEGLAKVRIGGYFEGKWGYVDHQGKRVIAVRFEEAGDFYKGEARVKINGKSMYIDKTGSNEEERKKQEAEEAESKKKERQAIIDKAIAQSKRDTLAREILNIYLAENPKLFEKVSDLKRDVESTMIFDTKYGFNKRNWLSMSTVIENKVIIARKQVDAYKSLLKPYEKTKKKNELYDRITVNFEKISDYISSCQGWGNYIETMGEYDNGKSALDNVGDQLTALKKDDDALRLFIKLYKQRNGLL